MFVEQLQCLCRTTRAQIAHCFGEQGHFLGKAILGPLRRRRLDGWLRGLWLGYGYRLRSG